MTTTAIDLDEELLNRCVVLTVDEGREQTRAIHDRQREEAFAMCRQVTGEDRAICEAVQTNLAAGVYDRGRLSPRHEAGVCAFQQDLRAALSGAG